MLKGKTAVVTGGARGIGAAICRGLAAQHADIAIFDFSNREQAESLCGELRQQYGVKALYRQVDVSDEEQCANAVKETADETGNVTILVNNAGITRDNLMLSMKDSEFDAVVNTNLKGCFHMTKACYRPFIRQKYGKIINIASVSAIIGNAGQANYAASKAGVIALTKVAAHELASKNVCCNAIAPGFIMTDMTAGLEEKYSGQIPLRRLGTPQDVANLAVFLASPLSDYITGELIRVDGGLVIS